MPLVVQYLVRIPALETQMGAVYHLPGLPTLPGAGGGGDPKELGPRIRRAIRFMEEHNTLPITIAALAEQACLSPGRFCHLFRQQTGTSPMQVLMRIRIERAQFLLGHDAPLGERDCLPDRHSERGHVSPRFSSRVRHDAGRIPPREACASSRIG